MMLPNRLVVLDLETTGLDPSKDSIVQVASCVLSRKDLLEENSFETYVRPTSPISAEAHAVHGLTAESLSSAPTVREAIQKFDSYAPADAIMCGHNVAFDIAFLKAGYAVAGMKYRFDYHALDLWSVAFFVLGAQRITLPAYNLTTLCSLYGIARRNRHDAMQDVRATAQVLRQLFAAIKGEELNVLGQYKLFQR